MHSNSFVLANLAYDKFQYITEETRTRNKM